MFKKPAPTQQTLDKLVSAARIIRILEWAQVPDSPTLGTAAIFETYEPADLASFRQAFEIEPAAPFFCMCIGELVIELRDADKVKARLTLHHGNSIRWDGWSSNAQLRDGRRAVEWLAEHGVAKPLRDYDAASAEYLAAAESKRRWRLAMPTSLRAFLPAVMGPFFAYEATEAEMDAMDMALRTAYGREENLILNLLEWFGHGEGPWSGFPSYEQMGETLLLRYPTAAIVRSLSKEPLTPAQLEGAARLFASFGFRKQRGPDLSGIPSDIVKRLDSHMEAAELAENRVRFKRAFGL